MSSVVVVVGLLILRDCVYIGLNTSREYGCNFVNSQLQLTKYTCTVGVRGQRLTNVSRDGTPSRATRGRTVLHSATVPHTQRMYSTVLARGCLVHWAQFGVLAWLVAHVGE